MELQREYLIKQSSELDMNSKIELFNFMISHKLNYMENANGVFFSLCDIDDNMIGIILEKVSFLKQFQADSRNLFFEATDTNKVDIPKIEHPDKVSIVQLDNCIMKDIESCNQKISKKNIHLKYAIAKKKYNKQTASEGKKIEDTDLNELTVEQYILA